MNEFQLSGIPTIDLVALRDAANKVLAERRREDQKKLRRIRVKEIDEKPPEDKTQCFFRNSSGLYSLPNHYARMQAANVKYLPALIAQDWSAIYYGGDSAKDYYVYAHVDPRKAVFSAQNECGGNYGGRPFYIGKGKGDRAFDLKRNQGHGKLISDLLNDGFKKDEISKIIFYGLSEAKAFEIESKLIYYFGTVYAGSSKRKGLLLNLDTPPVPEFIGQMISDMATIQREIP